MNNTNNKHIIAQSTHPPPSNRISRQSTLPPTSPSARRLLSATTALLFLFLSYSLQLSTHRTRRHRTETPSRALTHRLRYRLRQHVPFLSFPAESYVYRVPPYVTSDICCPKGERDLQRMKLILDRRIHLRHGNLGIIAAKRPRNLRHLRNTLRRSTRKVPISG